MEPSVQIHIGVKVDRNSGFVMHSRVSADIRTKSETAFADCDVSLRPGLPCLLYSNYLICYIHTDLMTWLFDCSGHSSNLRFMKAVCNLSVQDCKSEGNFSCFLVFWCFDEGKRSQLMQYSSSITLQVIWNTSSILKTSRGVSIGNCN